MRQILPLVGAVLVMAGMARGQAVETSPHFDVVDVHASAPGAMPYARGGFLPGGRYELRGATMLDLIKTAWSVDSESVFGGPSWLETDRFDVIAKAPPASTEGERATMLRAVLTDRFKFVFHKDEKSLPVYVLTAGKRTAQFQESAGTGEPACRPTGMEQGPPQLVVAACQNMTMEGFAVQLRQMAGGYADHQVIDLTGVTGAWDFTLKWSPRVMMAAPSPAGGDAEPVRRVSLFEALDKQLGLKLEAQKRTVPVMVVDSVNRMPTANLPGVTQSLPAPITEFEVAEIKPSQPGATAQSGQFHPGGRMEFRNFPLKELISVAWEVDQNKITGGPKWLDSDRFDLVAKAATGASTTPPPIDTLRLMLRALLVDRFKMKTHNEDQPVPVFELVVAKRGSKLKDADPSSRSSCKPGAANPDASSSLIVLTLTCQNTTMAQFADTIKRTAGGYLVNPVVDMTDLKGAYDFSISWTPIAQMRPQTRPPDAAPPSGAAPAASTPTNGLTVFEAAERQLGLQFKEGQKRPMPVLVIDHVEQIVAGN